MATKTYFYNRPGGKFVKCDHKTALSVMNKAARNDAYFVLPVAVTEIGTDFLISDLEPKVPGAGVAAVRFNRALFSSGPEGVQEALDAYYAAALMIIAGSMEE